LCLDDGLIKVETFGYFDKTKQLVLIGSYFDCCSSLRSVRKAQQDVSHLGSHAFEYYLTTTKNDLRLYDYVSGVND